MSSFTEEEAVAVATGAVLPVDTGLACLVMMARLHHVAVEPRQLLHEFGSSGGRFTAQDLLLAARHLGLKARLQVRTPEQLLHLPVPVMASSPDGTWFLIARIEGDRILVHLPGEPAPRFIAASDFAGFWSGQVILVTSRAARSGALQRFGVRWFIPVIMKYRHLLRDVLVVSFLLQLLALVSPLFFQVVVDKVLGHDSQSTLVVLCLGLGLVSVFEVVLGALRTYVFSHTTNRIDVELGARLFRHLMSLPLPYFSARRVGDSVARLRELENIRGFLTGSALTVVIDLFFALAFVAVMLNYSVMMTAVVLLSIPCYVLLSLCVTPLVRARLAEKFARGAENQAFLVETVSGIDTLKSLAVEPRMRRQWDDQLAAYAAASYRTGQIANLAGQGAQLINKVTMALVLWFGARAVMAGELTVGQFVAFNMLAQRLSAPVLRLSQLWQDFQQAGLSLRRLADILDVPAESRAESRTALPAIHGRLTFEDVVFRYRPDAPLSLRGVSFDLRPGEVVGIVGRSGSGKSTIARLMQRLYVPEQGRVLVDGVDVAQVDPAWLRRQMGVVPQEGRLFSRSIRDNIALGDPGLSLERVMAAAKLAGAHEFILALPDGYDTAVGEQGVTLSGGQRQRIALARALVTRPRILILDEATSALDDESEQVIFRNMKAICEGRTVIIIAHRLSAIHHAHRLFAIDRGELVEQGSPGELLVKERGYCQQLFASQLA
ncbi:MAG TPA: type I secretion system permease/ATPase [Moraxellaceae bacterium]|nr:type I secretion system permease/ATPase [Moraxellaceae bacterium]